MVWTALCLAVLSWPLQVLSHATTCNQGDYSAFMMGSVVSTPLLLCIAVLLLADRKASRPRVAAAVGLAACLLTMVLVDWDIVSSTIVHGTPCGPDYVDALAEVDLGHRLVILLAYLVLPLVNMALAGLFILRATRGVERRDLRA